MSILPENLQAGRYLCSNNWPYLSAGLWALQPVETKGLKTIGVDKFWRLYYDPDLTWDVQGIATVLYHEMNHLLRNHPLRAENILQCDPKAFNICADAEINDDISSENNVKWPDTPILPKDLKQANGLLAEEYYSNLPKVTIKISGPGSGNCGSCADGNQRPHEKDAPIRAGGTSDTPGISPVEEDLVHHHIAQEIRDRQNSRGDVPAHLQRLAQEILNPKVDWRKLLKAQVRHTMADIRGRKDFTFKRPSRRSASFPRIILPAMIEPIPNTAIVLDVSGSISGDALTSAMSEINGILKSCGVQRGVPVYVTDAAVHSAKKVFSVNQIELTGGGGTDMRIGMDRAMAAKEKPHLLVILTDGFTPWPSEAPKTKVIIALIGGSVDASACPSYAKVVKVE